MINDLQLAHCRRGRGAAASWFSNAADVADSLIRLWQMQLCAFNSDVLSELNTGMTDGEVQQTRNPELQDNHFP